LEVALAKKDWTALEEQVGQVSRGLGRLEAGPSLHALTNWNEAPTVHDLREQLRAAKASLAEVEQAIKEKNAEKLEAALAKFRKAYEPLREVAKRAGK
jgi:hypothetical protein